MSDDAAFITRLPAGPGASGGAGDATGDRVAVKDCIDVAGVVSTWGSPAVADTAAPAAADAACVARVRAAGATIVGKTNLHELCFGATGVNPWYGTPVNPLDPARIPGGSSSGSAVAVATGAADWALGTDTTGSVRTPAACCGVFALRPTHGRLPLDGVAPLAPSLDTVGPLAPSAPALVRGATVLDPDLGDPNGIDAAALRVGRLHLPGTDPRLDAAVDAALAAAPLAVVELSLDGLDEVTAAGRTVLFAEAWRSLGHLYRDRPDRIGDEVRRRFEQAAAVDGDDEDGARAALRRWRERILSVFERVDLLAAVTTIAFPPRIDERDPAPNPAAIPAAAAGLPASAQPVPSTGPLPASLQLIGRPGGDATVLAAVAAVDGAGPAPSPHARSVG